MKFLRFFDKWSVIHFFGSMIMVLLLHDVFNVRILPSVAIALCCGIFWEVFIDKNFTFGNLEGGDYWDIVWNIIGIAYSIFIINFQ